MNKDESIAVGQADFENTLTPEEAEEFDRLAVKLAAEKHQRPSRDQLLEEGRIAIAALDAYLVRVRTSIDFEVFEDLVVAGINQTRSGLVFIAGALAMQKN
jgi:hypothetical protein